MMIKNTMTVMVKRKMRMIIMTKTVTTTTMMVAAMTEGEWNWSDNTSRGDSSFSWALQAGSHVLQLGLIKNEKDLS